MRRANVRTELVLCVLGIIPVVWAALLAAPAWTEGLPDIMANLTAAMADPLHIEWCEDSPKAVLLFICAYGMGIGIYLSTRKNTRPREEHGSAKWGDASAICRKYRDRRFSQNKILTQNVRIGLDAQRHRRTLNTMVVGGSGAGKSRFFAKPNAMQANTSMVILDPKGVRPDRM